MKTIHAVFKKEFHDRIKAYYDKEENKSSFKVINYDTDINTFRHYMLMQKDSIEIADIALVAVSENYDVPLAVQIKELIEKTVEVKLAHNDLRILLILPQSFKQDIRLVTELVSIGIYDIHFKNDFDFTDLNQWMNVPKTLADMRDYIKANAKDPREFAALFNHADPPKETTTEVVINEVEKTKVITKKETVEKVVRLTTTILQKNIGVLALTKGAGSTFVATNFASYLAEQDLNIGLYENPKHAEQKTYLADVFNLFSEIEAKNQKDSVPHKIVQKTEHYLSDPYNVMGVDVYATNYALGPIKEFKPHSMMKYINTGKQSVKIIDLGCFTDQELNEEAFTDLLSLFDSLLIVVDLLPTSIIPYQNRLKQLQKRCKHFSDMDLMYILNRFDGEIPLKKYKHLELDSVVSIAGIDHSALLAAMFKKQTVYTHDNNIREKLKPVYSVVANSLGIEVLNEKEPRPKKLFNLFAK